MGAPDGAEGVISNGVPDPHQPEASVVIKTDQEKLDFFKLLVFGNEQTMRIHFGDNFSIANLENISFDNTDVFRGLTRERLERVKKGKEQFLVGELKGEHGYGDKNPLLRRIFYKFNDPEINTGPCAIIKDIELSMNPGYRDRISKLRVRETIFSKRNGEWEHTVTLQNITGEELSKLGVDLISENNPE